MGTGTSNVKIHSCGGAHEKRFPNRRSATRAELVAAVSCAGGIPHPPRGGSISGSGERPEEHHVRTGWRGHCRPVFEARSGGTGDRGESGVPAEPRGRVFPKTVALQRRALSL